MDRKNLKASGFLFFAVFLLAASCGGGRPADTGDGLSHGCTQCHTAQAEAWENFSSHQGIYTCGFCHEKVSPDPGEGHRTSPACSHCHSQSGHPSPLFGGSKAGETTCLTCHEPHGSPNLFLIRENLRTTQGEQVSIDFRNIEGKADVSYAEKGWEEGGTNDLEPGSGLCEACHTGTRVYNSTGRGRGHYEGRCTVCHSHADGFRCAGCHKPAE